MPTRRQIEAKWVENFKKSPLVDKKNNSFLGGIASQLYNGATDPEYPDEYPRSFVSCYRNYSNMEPATVVSQLIIFLHFIGITINKSNLENFIEIRPTELDVLMKKSNYIFKFLAYTRNLDLNRPFKDNYGDIFYLLQIEIGLAEAGLQTTIFDEGPVTEIHKRTISLPEGYGSDPTVKSLFNYIEKSNQCMFISGKAGTGKSTFIHYFMQNTQKNAMVFAFTGLAAINAGGQTLHSFFQFPLRALIPGIEMEEDEERKFKPGSMKYQIIKTVDTIIIDEVSMLRSDLLEALDNKLRFEGGVNNLPFGGKQIILVGDIFQLPPVVNEKDDLDNIAFKHFFKSQYFFDAPVYSKSNPKYFEFAKVHRQESPHFISLLDQVRMCNISNQSIEEINKRCNPNFVPPDDQFYIQLTTRNDLAEKENTKRLNRLPFNSYYFEAEIRGDFPEDRYPTLKKLELRRHAQVMLIKNATDKRWVNGTICKIELIADDLLEVILSDGTTAKLEREIWENVKYSIDKKTGKLISKVVGSFSQFPIKLAWAVTIHKSQGLTFQNVVIDLGAGAFVNGQTYTALSRCRTLSGITLKRPISRQDIISDERVMDFYTNQLKTQLK